jgi:hypothetical protein
LLWQVILAGHFGGLFWHIYLAGFHANETSGFQKKEKKSKDTKRNV